MVLLPATAASADPARPTNYRARILAIHPDLPRGFGVEVVGGDAFLELDVPHGHTAEVADYPSGSGTTPRPYLRFLADGTVERNDRSTAAAANQSRFGTSRTTPDPRARPRWRVVARHGSYVWHDHRIHWMSPTAPTAVDRRGRVDLGGRNGTWTVPMVVDGHPITVRGELLLLGAPNPMPWYALAAIPPVMAIGIGLRSARARRDPAYRAVALTAVVAGGAASVAGWAAWRSIPAAAGGNVLPFLVPAVGVAGAAIAVVAPTRFRLPSLGVAAACLLGWSGLRTAVFGHAVLPTDLPFALDRAATALALGVGLAVAVLLVWVPPRASRPA
ncbi:MAG: hypothetical protein JWM89_366 [Acidimicrobiales bacterium]|nr:hypothetical protein [Acidimicrobiales bacterium]